MNNAIRTLVPALVGGLARERPGRSDRLEQARIRRCRSRAPAVCSTAASASTRSTRSEGDQFVAHIFGGNDSNAVASALAGNGAGSSDLIKKLLPILAPIVLAYIGKQLTKGIGAGPEPRRSRPAAAGSVTSSAASWAARGGGGGGGNNPLGSILGSVLGGGRRPEQSDRRDPRRPARRQEVALAVRSPPAQAAIRLHAPVFLEWRGDRQPTAPGRRPAQVLGSGRGRERPLRGLGRCRLLQGRRRPATSPPYSIVLPPPNVTGSLHMGHALDHTLMDALTRRKRMQGFEVLWLPGMDHAGIATQSVVEKQLAVDGKTKEDFGRELFIDKVWDWKHDSGGTIGGADAAARRRRRLEPRPVHHGRRPVPRGAHHLQAALRRRV